MSVATRQLTGRILLALGFLLLAAGPFLLFTTGYSLDIAQRALYYALLAGTWSFLSGVAGQFSFAHVSLSGLGGYAGAVWSAQLAGSGWIAGWGPSIVFGTLFGTVLGLLLGLLLQRLAGAYLALFTIAFAEVARLVVVAEVDLTGGRLSLAVHPNLPGSGTAHYYLLLVLLVVTLAGIYALLRSHIGLNLQAMREDAGAAAAMGVNVRAHKLFALGLAAAMASLGGSVYYHTVDRMAPENLDLLLMSQIIAFTVIGGLERPLAAAASAVILSLVLENLRDIDLNADQVLVLAFAVAAIPLAVALWYLRQALRRQRRTALLTAARAALPWAVPGFLLLAWWLHAPDGMLGRVGSTIGWLVLVAAVVLVVRAGAAAQHRAPEVRQATAATLVAVGGLLTGGKLYTYLEIEAVPGVWRLTVFGALLALTLRFAPNGLFTPVLDYFAGRDQTRALAVADREPPRAGAAAVEQEPAAAAPGLGPDLPEDARP